MRNQLGIIAWLRARKPSIPRPLPHPNGDVLQRFQCLELGDRGVVDGIRFENGEQAGGPFRQAFRVFGQNVSVVNFDFNGPIAHGVKLRLHPPGCKERFPLEATNTRFLDSSTAASGSPTTVEKGSTREDTIPIKSQSIQRVDPSQEPETRWQLHRTELRS